MICGRLLYIRLPPFCPATSQDAQSRCFPSLCPASLVLRGASLLAEMLPAVSLLLSHFFFSSSNSAPTQLARLFIKTSKLTAALIAAVRFMLVVTLVYYLLRRPISATSFRSLILSRKSRPPKPHLPLFTLAVRFHSLLFHILAIPHLPFSHTIPFTPSTAYRSTSRNVVLAFARIPFYPSAWRLILVSSLSHTRIARRSLFSLPFLSIPYPNAHLFTIPTFASLPFSHAQLANYVSRLHRGSSNTRLSRWAAPKRGLMKNKKWRGNARDGNSAKKNRLNQRWRRIAERIM